MLRFIIQVLNRVEREFGWLNHFHKSHKINSFKKLYQYYIGFAPEQYVTYNLAKNSTDAYISDKLRFFGLPRVHGDYMVVLKDKSIFYSVLDDLGFCNHLPTRYKNFSIDLTTKTQNIGIEDGTYILKPSLGSSGHGVIKLDSKNGQISLAKNQLHEIKENYDDEDDFLLEEYIPNSVYSSNIFDGALNTIRILTIWDYENKKPFIAGASHKFGTRQSAPIDNASSGGIYCPIALESGRLGPAFVADGSRERSAFHPDTQAKLEDVEVKKWDQLKEFVIEVAAALPFCPLIGWDVAVDENDRFMIIEANPTPGFGLIQAHTPLLENPDVRSFLAHYSLL